MSLDERKQKEIEHSDRRRTIVRGYEYHTDASQDQRDDRFIQEKGSYDRHFSNMKFYSITGSSNAYRDGLLFNNIKGAMVLDYCCGNGEVSIEMAKRGAAHVVGIDLSPVAIKNAESLAREADVHEICEFKVMDAEHTIFADRTFDVIHEYGALHHLDLGAAYKELARIVKPTGKIVCTEALRHNPIIHWYRKRTPNLRTNWEFEHILGIPEIERGREYFSSSFIRTFHLTALIAVPLRKTFVFGTLLKLCDSADRFLLSLPALRRMAWIAVFEFKQPIN